MCSKLYLPSKYSKLKFVYARTKDNSVPNHNYEVNTKKSQAQCCLSHKHKHKHIIALYIVVPVIDAYNLTYGFV